MSDSHQTDQAEILEAIDGAKLLRLGSMITATLNEVRGVRLDETGCRHLQTAHRRTVEELSELMPHELRDELARDVLLPMDESMSESELRIAHARLVGWLEGLFRGMQASVMSRKVASQLESLREPSPETPAGHYL